ncbi:MAG TPA: DUF2333 family protein, partial [Gammaproteobacteria bacterium]|nr:DUF2333 family protein [Gammaproteobacteria bacterium]
MAVVTNLLEFFMFVSPYQITCIALYQPQAEQQLNETAVNWRYLAAAFAGRLPESSESTTQSRLNMQALAPKWSCTMAFEKFTYRLIAIWEKLRLGFIGLGKLYHPGTWREKGLFWSIGLLLATAVIALLITGWLWNKEPGIFDVRQAAIAASGGEKNLVTGSYYTGTLLKIGDVILNKRGGYLS